MINDAKIIVKKRKIKYKNLKERKKERKKTKEKTE